MSRRPRSERFRYAFDNFMARGTIALIAGLFLASVVLVLLVSLVVLFLGGLRHDDTAGVDLVELIWLSILRTLDPGTMGGDTGTLVFVFGMLTVTLGGIVLVATLIGVINTGLEGRLAELRKGRSKVVEEGHVVVLGWSAQVFPIISELVLANANKRNQCVVVLADRDKVEMEDAIRQRLPNTRTTRVVCRTGSPLDVDELDIASPQTARSIIVLAPPDGDPDTDVIRTLLALTNAPNRRSEPYSIVAEISEPRNLEVARLASRGEARLVLTGELIGRIAAQTCRMPGLSVIYMDLLDFEGDEIYFQAEPSLAGTTFGEALHAFRDSALIGIAPSGELPILAPPMDRRIEASDRLIFLAEDDDTIQLSERPAGLPRLDRLAAGEPLSARTERTLILGWNRRTPTIMRELDRYCAPGSEQTVVADLPAARPGVEAAASELANTRVKFRHEDTTSRAVLDSLDVPSFDHVIIVAYSDALDDQRADGRTLVTLLHLRDIGARAERQFSIVSEMLDLRNRNLAQATRADDFIVSDRLVSLAVSQLAETPALEPIFADLFDHGGSEIYLKPAAEYVTPGDAVDFYTIVESAARQGEVAIGYRLLDVANVPARNYGVVLNPDKALPIPLQPDDRVIVLAEG